MLKLLSKQWASTNASSINLNSRHKPIGLMTTYSQILPQIYNSSALLTYPVRSIA